MMKTKKKPAKQAAAKSAKPAKPKAKAPARPAPAGKAAPHGPSDSRLESVLKEVTAEQEKTPIEDWVQVECPYCGEGFEVHVTSEDDGQTMDEDCRVCCRPISLHIHREEDELEVSAHRA